MFKVCALPLRIHFNELHTPFQDIQSISNSAIIQLVCEENKQAVYETKPIHKSDTEFETEQRADFKVD